MIIGPDFVWLHFPKCAGTSYESTLRRLMGNSAYVAFDDHDPNNVIWHQSIAERETYDPFFDLGKRKVICGIRRLPYWLLSRVHYEAGRPPHRIPSREMLIRGRFYEQPGQVNQADSYMLKYSAPRVDHWIRTEFLVEDTARAFALAPETVKKVMVRKNESKTQYIKELGFWFEPSELAGLYDANPHWAALEKRLYGELCRL